jgi:peptidoglycan hydrolase CwlO-like protein
MSNDKERLVKDYDGLKDELRIGRTGAIRLMTHGDMGCDKDFSQCTIITGWRVREVVFVDRVHKEQINDARHNNETGCWDPPEYERHVIREPLFLLEQDVDDTIDRLERDANQQRKTISNQRQELEQLQKDNTTLRQKVDLLTNQRDQEREERERAESKWRDLRSQCDRMERDLGTLRKQIGEVKWNKLLGRKE